jgi:hypothetical protein
MKRAAAEAARVSVQYAEQETKLLKHRAELEEKQRLSVAKEQALMERSKAELDADLKLLSQKKEAAKAEAELIALQQDQEESIFEHLPDGQLYQHRVDRTRQFVENQREMNFDNDNNLQPNSVTPHPTPRVMLEFSDQVSSVSDPVQADVPCTGEPVRCEPVLSTPGKPDCSLMAPKLNPYAETFRPTVPDMCSELTKFIVKKDLVLSRLTKFDDTPEYFPVWRSTFHNVMSELGVTPVEEMDLLIKYLGPESVIQAKRIRAANARDPLRGLQRIWERMEDRFALPEMVEASLKKKVQSFPRITSKDFSRLYEYKIRR